MKIRTLLMVLCAVVGVTLLSGCSKSPEAVVKAWHKAILAGDKAAADKLVTGKGAKEVNKGQIKHVKELRKRAKEDDDAAETLKYLEKCKVGTADIDEKEAEVTVSYGDDEERDRTFKLKKTDDGWKIKFGDKAGADKGSVVDNHARRFRAQGYVAGEFLKSKAGGK